MAGLMPADTGAETELNSPNPLLNEVVLDAVFSNLGLDDLKTCRLVCTLWAQIAVKSISKLPLQKPIQLETTEDFQNLFEFLSSQREIFSQHQQDHKLFQLTSFSFDIHLLASLELEKLGNFAQNFSPRYLEVIGNDFPGFQFLSDQTWNDCEHLDVLTEIGQLQRSCRHHDNQDCSTIQQKLPILLKNSSNTLVELKLDFKVNKNLTQNLDDILISTGFPNLTKFSFDCKTHYTLLTECQIVKNIFCPIVKNSPKLSSLLLATGLTSYPKFREFLTNLNLPEKLKDLALFDLNYEHIDVLTEFGQNDQLQLNKFTYKNAKIQNWPKSLCDFLGSQSANLTELHILSVKTYHQYQGQGEYPLILRSDYDKIFGSSYRHTFDSQERRIIHKKEELYYDSFLRYWNKLSDFRQQMSPPSVQRAQMAPYDIPKVFPILSNLTFLQIDDFFSWPDFFEQISFSSNFPNLVTFKTLQICQMLVGNYFCDAQLIQKVILKGESLRYFYTIPQFFKGVKHLEIDSNLMGDPRGREDFNFWRHLEKAVIHVEMKNLLNHIRVFRIIDDLELEVKCPDQMDESYLDQIVKDYKGLYENMKGDHIKFLRRISHYVKPKSFRLIGQKVPLKIQEDLKDLFPNFVYIQRGDYTTVKI